MRCECINPPSTAFLFGLSDGLLRHQAATRDYGLKGQSTRYKYKYTLGTRRAAQFKVAPPDHFPGERKKLREFLNQLRINFRFHAGAVNTEEKKVFYAATYLRDAAHDWFEPYLKDRLEEEEDNQEEET
ncbi:hypothetical protein GJ744_007321 [Endocarpon pusillum]|uniref:DUF4939 domain-containing protein n=1 Tax=Endocarpon pusillum TaxID=364733 RepID=A0A8H7A7L6_9EURO|nr:hypothetical protein GJ744_007321 [Endocarpon pusillum]